MFLEWKTLTQDQFRGSVNATEYATFLMAVFVMSLVSLKITSQHLFARIAAFMLLYFIIAMMFRCMGSYPTLVCVFMLGAAVLLVSAL